MEKILYGILFVLLAMIFFSIIDFIIEQNRIEGEVDLEKKAKSDKILEMYREIYSRH